MGTKGNISVSLVILVLLFGLAGNASAGTIYVDANAAPGGNGSTWGTAYKYLQDAFYEPPTSGDEIWVAEGTYTPDQDEGSNVTLGDRYATFELKDGVSVYGGFPIGGGTWEERDPNQHETILSGDLNGDDGPDFFNNGENSYVITTVSWANGITILDGVTIMAGNADTSDRTAGGGLYNSGGGDIIVSNCKFVKNYASQWGGSVLLYLSNATEFINCSFVENKTTGRGGAISFFEVVAATIRDCKFINNLSDEGGAVQLWWSSATIISCSFVENDSREGGALHCYSFGGWPEDEKYSNTSIINSEFTGNKVSSDGGAVYFRGECHSSIINCSFVGNSASDEGGAIYEAPVFQNVYADFINCNLIGNTAGNVGGGIADMYSPNGSTLKNCIVWGNKDSSGINELSQIRTPVTVTYSCIQDDDPDDGSIPFGGAANNNIDDDPNFVRDPYDGGDGWGVGNNDDYGNLRLQYVSPCIDTADNASVPADLEDLDEDLNTAEPIPYDLDEHPRIVDGDCNSTDVVDMGAYEFSYISLGDFAGGCDVDFADFAVLALAWLTEEGQAGYNSNCDIALPYDGAIDEKDLQVFTDNWLLGR